MRFGGRIEQAGHSSSWGRAVLITVHCPGCRTKYQLKPEMLGQRTRCPNSACREVFEVQEDRPSSQTNGDPAETEPRRLEPATEIRQTSGHVGDLVPLVRAEAVSDVDREALRSALSDELE